MPCYSADAPPSSPQLPEKLGSVARRILNFKNDAFEPSPPPQLLDKLTNELLIVAVDAVWAAAAAAMTISGVARYRLLAWTVADARGATVPLDKPLALTVGKRIERQAIKTRADLASVADAAQAARDRAREAADRASEGGPAREGLPSELAAIDQAEQARLNELRDEVYIGFNELESLLPSESDVVPRVADETAEVRFPYLLGLDERDDYVAAIPPDLVAILGPDATQALWQFATRNGNRGPSEPDFWWSIELPGFAGWLMIDDPAFSGAVTAREHGFVLEELALAQEAARAARKRATECASDMEAMEETYEAEVARLQGALREAKGREDALQGVVAQWMGAHGVERGHGSGAEP